MAIKQLSVFLENKPGSLVHIAKTISESGVDMRAMSVADTQDFGILRLIVSDTEKAKSALTKEECVVTATQVVGVKMSDKTGALYDVITVLSNAGINIEYMYAFTASSDYNAYVVLRVDDNDGAESVLHANGIPTITDEDVKTL